MESTTPSPVPQGASSPPTATMATSPTIPAEVQEDIPPASPLRPRIAFNPPLFIQRRMAIHTMLRELSSSPRFKNRIHSFIDVGCGTDCLLLRSLIPCEDELPLEQITGIDIDEKIGEPWVAENLAPGGFGASSGGAEDRWRPLNVTLLNGSFVYLSPKTVPRHDIIVSTEVIEHLDPVPLSNFSSVLLGKMKPKICIITTPNREFNKLFDTPFYPLNSPTNTQAEKPDCSPTAKAQSIPPPPTDFTSEHASTLEQTTLDISNSPEISMSGQEPPPPSSPLVWEDEVTEGRYWRRGVPYSMRHRDHRFEWTRKEFRDWATNAASLFGYDVFFTGVGGLGRGLQAVRGPGWDIIKTFEEAAEDQSCPEEYYHTDSRFDSKDVFTEPGLEDHICADGQKLSDRAKIALGDCSQIAVFLIKEDIEKEWEEVQGFRPRQGSVTIRSRSGSRTEGTATPCIAGSLARSITPDSWFSHPSSGTDINLVCNHVFPWCQDEFPPNCKIVLEMMEEVLFYSIPNLVLKEWQRVLEEADWLAREQDGRLWGTAYGGGSGGHMLEMDLFVDDYFTNKGQRERRREEKELEEKLAARNLAMLRGKKVENIKEVRITLGAKRIWQTSWKLQRACRFHYDIFKEIISGTGSTGILGLVDEETTRNLTSQIVINTLPASLSEEMCSENLNTQTSSPSSGSQGKGCHHSIPSSQESLTHIPPNEKHMVVEVSKSPTNTASMSNPQTEDVNWTWSTVKAVFNPRLPIPPSTTPETPNPHIEGTWEQPVLDTPESSWTAWDDERDSDWDEKWETESEKNGGENSYNGPWGIWKPAAFETEVSWNLDTEAGKKLSETLGEEEEDREDVLVLAKDEGLRTDGRVTEEGVEEWEDDNVKMKVRFFRPKVMEAVIAASGVEDSVMENEQEGDSKQGGENQSALENWTATNTNYFIGNLLKCGNNQTLVREDADGEWGSESKVSTLKAWNM